MVDESGHGPSRSSGLASLAAGHARCAQPLSQVRFHSAGVTGTLDGNPDDCAGIAILHSRFSILVEMPGRGLEPLRIAPPDPKSGASANFATLANCDAPKVALLAASGKLRL